MFVGLQVIKILSSFLCANPDSYVLPLILELNMLVIFWYYGY
jgi:hypothetical protein